uniref:Rab GDP dissociation inhibitor n=1 Tax=Plasmodium falciparum TaxID=5833 RepID=Q26001_PLAFA|nr:rabGDI [Plasmodium falciparum 3D7]
MNEHYDVIILGTGLKECILSGLLSHYGKKILVLDRNPYYGGETASLNLTNLYNTFKPKENIPSKYGENRHWNVDLIPKFILVGGNLVKILKKTRVTNYLEWLVVEGSYVYQHQKKGFLTSEKFIHKVPATDMEALVSPLLSLMEKNRCKNFYQYVSEWDANKRNTWDNLDPYKLTMLEIYKHFNLCQLTIDFLGHAVALYLNDDYLKQPAYLTLERIKLYMQSISAFGKSPFIYPLYGLGGIPEGFSRMCAINGGTFMLNKNVVDFVFDDDNKVCGIKSSDGEIAYCDKVICDPSYVMHLKNKIKKIGQVIRCICILSNPIPETNQTNSCQIIIPQNQLNRKSDIYINLASFQHGVTLKGKYIAIVSATVETNNPIKEIEKPLELLGTIEEKFVKISDLYVSTSKKPADNIFVTSSYDATSHFETATNDLLQIWENLWGQKLNFDDLNTNADGEAPDFN